jgi:hypothetical protein
VHHDAAKEHEEHEAFSRRIIVFSCFHFVSFVMKGKLNWSVTLSTVVEMKDARGRPRPRRLPRQQSQWRSSQSLSRYR